MRTGPVALPPMTFLPPLLSRFRRRAAADADPARSFGAAASPPAPTDPATVDAMPPPGAGPHAVPMAADEGTALQRLAQRVRAAWRAHPDLALLALAVLFGGAAMLLTHGVIDARVADAEQALQERHPWVRVVVAREDLPRGTPITAQTFAVREVPAPYVHASAVRADGFERVERQRLGSTLQRGEVLLLEHLDGAAAGVFSSMVRNGRRALTVEVDDRNAIAGLLRPGDRIDLLVSVRDPRNAGETTWPLLSNIEVLATGQAVRRSDGQGERAYSSVTLDVSPQDAHRIVVARAAGALSAVLRHPEDAGTPRLAPLALDDVIGRPRGAASRPAAVEVLVGGVDAD